MPSNRRHGAARSSPDGCSITLFKESTNLTCGLSRKLPKAANACSLVPVSTMKRSIPAREQRMMRRSNKGRPKIVSPARVGALIRARMDKSLASGALGVSGFASPVLVPYSSKSLILSADCPIIFSSRWPFSSIRNWASSLVSMRPERAVVMELLPFSVAAMKTLLLDWSPAAPVVLRSMKKTRLPLDDS